MASAHNISIEVGGYRVDHWTTYSIENNMLEPADAFSMEIAPVTRDLFELVPPDAKVIVMIDDIKVLTGYIDERIRGDDSIRITGRDRGGRLLDTTMPLQSFHGMSDLKRLAEAVIGSFLGEVVFSNAANRDKVRGPRAKKVAAYREPSYVWDRGKAPKKVEPGETRWAVLEAWLQPAQLLAWSSADGTQLIIGHPNYEQPCQFAFFRPAPQSARAREGNVLPGYELITSVADRYSQITVVGASKGDGANYSSNVRKHRGIAKDGGEAFGAGASFQLQKTLLLSDDDVKSASDAEDRAEREMAIRDASGETIRFSVAGHSQQYDRASTPTLYACDLMCSFEDEEIAWKGNYLITSVRFNCSRDRGETTDITLVPDGTALSL